METILCGDALEQLRTLEPGSVHTCVTSPPYYGLRDYGADGQIGRESTPEEYIGRLVEVFREVRRVLRPDGTLWVNIGDSYATRSGPQPPANTRNQCGHTAKRLPDGYKCKDLIGVPWMLALALRSDGWYLRQDIIWAKTRCLPESVRDRCTRSHEYLFLLSKSARYHFDDTAIKEPVAESTKDRLAQDIDHQAGSFRQPEKSNGPLKAVGGDRTRNKRSVWSLPTAHFQGAHFAVFPERLVEPCILAGCPEGGVVLDPFMGSGTTGTVAKRLRRDFVGVEINPDYCEMARARIAGTMEQPDQISIAAIRG